MGAETPKRVLVVDDDAAVATVVRRILESAGHSVHCLLDASLALRCVEERSVDLVITDLIMSDLDGAELIRRLNELENSPAIVAMSGGGAYLTPEEALQIARTLRVSAVLKKPFTPADLLRCVDSLALAPAT